MWDKNWLRNGELNSFWLQMHFMSFGFIINITALPTLFIFLVYAMFRDSMYFFIVDKYISIIFNLMRFYS